MRENNKPILFFDGHCNLCNGFIDFLVRKDRNRKVLIASLQGKTAQQTLPPEAIEKLASVVYMDSNKELHYKSSAIFRVAWQVGGWLHIITPFRILPRFFTNWIYDFVALTRYSFFGRRDTCRIPTEEERRHFLD